ncbi:MAG TPA: glycosyltransferase family 4 protein [Pseudacidobacterium sp.]|nr:glycosyltransferase family 4 protein [Pseudacidobacterium sp.]
MKILLSAYACEPHKGSEPAVGWNWMLSLIGQGHEVFVLTRKNNAPAIESEIKKQHLSVTPVYYDLPSWCRRWKHWPGGLYFYYLFWQLGAYFYAKQLHKVQRFDLVHHITFATFRQPSFMGRLGIPFVLGPVGGGETSPRHLRRGFNWSGRLRETLRDIGIAWASHDPLMHSTFSHASWIACTTHETLKQIPGRYHSKCIVQPAIGIDSPQLSSSISQPSRNNFLFIGRLLYWKGLHLVLRAFPDVLQRIPDARLRIIGEGEDSDWLKSIAQECGISSAVDWIPWMPHQQIAAEYENNIAFVFPSLHDSGGLVVLESLAASLPVICLDLGGPAIFVDDSCGIVISTSERNEASVQKTLAQAMISLASDPERRNLLASGCQQRVRQFSWHSGADHLYSFISSEHSR